MNEVLWMPFSDLEEIRDILGNIAYLDPDTKVCYDRFGKQYKSTHFMNCEKFTQNLKKHPIRSETNEEDNDIHSKKKINEYIKVFCPSVDIHKFYNYYASRDWTTNSGSKLDTFDKIKEIADSWERRNFK